MPSPGISTSSSASSSRPSTAPMRSPSTGMSTAPSPADQSTSNQSRVRRVGPLGAAPTTARGCARRASARPCGWARCRARARGRRRAPPSPGARSAGRPPSSGAISSWSTTSYPCVEPGRGPQDRRQVHVRDAERREVRHALRRRRRASGPRPAAAGRSRPARACPPSAAGGSGSGAVRSCARARLGGPPLRLLVGRLAVPRGPSPAWPPRSPPPRPRRCPTTSGTAGSSGRVNTMIDFSRELRGSCPRRPCCRPRSASPCPRPPSRRPPNRLGGSVNVAASGWPLNSTRKLSSTISWPRRSGSAIASPLRNTMTARAWSAPHASSRMW